jgi:hypothetical protein
MLALVGWQVFGPSLVGVLLIAVAVLARLVVLGLWLRDRFRAQAVPGTRPPVPA